MSDFTLIDALDLQTVKKEISFPVNRESLISEDNHVDSKKDLIMKDTIPLGIISKKKNLIPYGGLMDWTTGEFDNLNLDYKLRESVITKTGDLYQEYVFDHDVPSPDGNSMTAMAILKASYTGTPFHLMFGTYRFVCRNGVIVGETVGNIKIRSNAGSDFLKTSLVDDLHFKLDRYKQVVGKYSTINNEAMSVHLLDFLQTEYIPAMMRKAVIYALRDEGSIELTVDKLKKEHLENAVPSLLNVVKDQSMFYLYNLATAYATHEARSVNARNNHYQAISKYFEI